MNAAERQARAIAELRAGTGSSTQGVVDSQDWDNRLVTVNTGGAVQTVGWAGPAPWPGDTVRLVSLGGSSWCELVEGAPLGSVTSVGSGRATVAADDGRSYTYPYLGTVPGVSDRVALDHARRLVLGAISAEPEASEFVPRVAPATRPTVRKQWFAPTWSGNYRGGVFQNPQVSISTTRTGFYGYGTQIRDTIPGSASIRVARLVLSENYDQVPGVASSMGLHGHITRPGSADNSSLSGAYSVPGLELDITGSVIAAFISGAAYGVGFRSGASGFREYGAAPGSGRIYVEWSV